MAFDDTNKELLLYNTHLNVNFKESPTRANVKSGENISTSLGKVQKYFNDLGDAAFLDTDTTPTQNSTNPITSGAVYTALDSKQDTLTQAQLAAANSGITSAKLTADEAALVELVDAGAKNLYPIGVLSYIYASAVTCTVAADGKITVNGTNPYTTAGILYQDLVTAETTWKNTRYTLPAGKYGCKGSGVTGLSIQVYCHDGTNAKELFNSTYDGVFEYTEEDKAEKPYIAWRLGISASAAISNATVHPLICAKTAWDISHAFVSYRLPYQQISDAVLNKTPVVYGSIIKAKF